MPPKTALNQKLRRRPYRELSASADVGLTRKTRTMRRERSHNETIVDAAHSLYCLGQPPLRHDEVSPTPGSKNPGLMRVAGNGLYATPVRTDHFEFNRTAGRRMRLALRPIRAGKRRSFPSILRAAEKPTPTAFRSTHESYTPARSRATTLVTTSVILIALFRRGSKNFLSHLAISR